LQGHPEEEDHLQDIHKIEGLHQAGQAVLHQVFQEIEAQVVQEVQEVQVVLEVQEVQAVLAVQEVLHQEDKDLRVVLHQAVQVVHLQARDLRVLQAGHHQACKEKAQLLQEALEICSEMRIL